MALGRAASAAARADDPVQHHRLRHAFESVAAALIGDEQSSHLTLHPRRDNDRTRLGQGLCSCCDVGHIAENLARRVDDNRPQVDGNARSDALPDVGSGSSASIERAPATSAVHPISDIPLRRTKCSDGPRPCEKSTRYNRTRNFEACGHAQSKKTGKFIFRSALRPNQISFSHSLGQNEPPTSWPAATGPPQKPAAAAGGCGARLGPKRHHCPLPRAREIGVAFNRELPAGRAEDL